VPAVSSGWPSRPEGLGQGAPIGADFVVRGALDYAELKVKPGQTIRILVREVSSSTALKGYCPEILLTMQ
jgi:hypothetical protein